MRPDGAKGARMHRGSAAVAGAGGEAGVKGWLGLYAASGVAAGLRPGLRPQGGGLGEGAGGGSWARQGCQQAGFTVRGLTADMPRGTYGLANTSDNCVPDGNYT